MTNIRPPRSEKTVRPRLILRHCVMTSWRLNSAGILIVKPSGPLRATDFEGMADEVDALLARGGKLRGVLIDAPQFPGWRDFSAAQSHFVFVREHHRIVPRVAVVSDSRILSALPKIARHFLHADIRNFPGGETEAALAWIESPLPEHAPALRHAWFPTEKILWVGVNGRVTKDDYDAFRERLEGILATTSPVSVLVDIARFETVEPAAVFADMKFGMRHIRDFRRIAVIGEEGWVRRAGSFPNPFPFKIRGFGAGAEHEAWEWLLE